MTGGRGDGAGSDEDDEDDDEDGAVERLTIHEWEREDMQRLAPLFHTPRAVKRFVNSYRFLRAGVQAHEMPSFTGTKEEPGTYRAALVLLAVVVSHTNVAPRLLRCIMDARHGAHPPRWRDFVHHVRADGATDATFTDDADIPVSLVPPRSWEEVEWRQLCDALLEVGRGDGAFPVRDVAELKPWIPVVARHSFSLSALATLAT